METKKIKLLINNEFKEYELLYTFESNITNNNYLLCTDNSINDRGKINIYAFIYYPSNKGKGIVPIKQQQDWDEVEKFINIMEAGEND